MHLTSFVEPSKIVEGGGACEGIYAIVEFPLLAN